MPNTNKKPKMIDHEPSGEPKRKISKRNNDSKMFADLKSIFHDESGDLPDMTKLDRRKRSPRAVLVGLILFFAVLAGAAWAGFFLFKPYARFEGNGSALVIDGPREVMAGEPVRYEFRYENTERVGLAALELRLVIPREFQILESVPAPTSAPSTWTLGSQPRGESQKVMLRGFFMGGDADPLAFQAVATYRPANFNADFQAITTLPVAINGSVLDTKIEGPTETAPGEQIEYIYTIKNTGSEPMSEIELHLEAANAFIIASGEPAPTDLRNRVWALATLEPGSENVIKVKGAFAATAQGKTELPFALGTFHEDTWFPHRQDLASTDVLASDVALELVVSGNTTNFAADFGETLNATLSYKNLGARTIGDLALSLRITASPGGLIDWDRATMVAPGRVRNGIITWTKQELPALGRVLPGADGSIDVSLPIVDNPPAREGTDELLFSSSALISTLDGRLVARQVETTPLIVTLNSDVAFTESAARRDGALPPRARETTTVRISWDTTNTRHDLENIRIRTTLPADVRWIGNTITTLGTINWDEATRTVTFQAGKLAVGEKLQAAFDVDIAPSAAQVGTFVALTGETTASARDIKTGSTISHIRDPMSSELLTDESGASRGIVVE